MSGTSLDGVDVVVADFCASSPVLVGSYFLPYDASLCRQLLELHQTGYDELHQAALSSNQLSQIYAQAVDGLLQDSGISVEYITAIGCHGQTVRHRPEAGYTIQLLNAALLAELSGITVVSDFRSRDIAAGGQGAPLVPAFHKALFSDDHHHRAIVNIGGISNVTNLSPNQSVTGFDCGPGNMLMDAWCLRHTGRKYDDNGDWAASGNVIPALLDKLLATEYFKCPPPKSTGRDLFNMDWLVSHLVGGEAAVDVQATLLELTVIIIAQSLHNYCDSVQEVYICGGGARNGALMTRLGQIMSGKLVSSTNELGIDANWVEAYAFAWLARQAILGEPGNLPEVTGAKGSRILGAIYPA